MPTYGYRCTECNHEFEVLQRITEDPLTECERCKGEVKRVLFPVGIVFKGSGFHVNDYRKPDKSGGNGHKETKETKTETPKPPEKTEAKS